MPGFFISCTGYSLSEALILTPNNPNYDDRLFVELQVQFKKVHYMLCTLGSRIEVPVRLLFFGFFPQPVSLIWVYVFNSFSKK